MINSFADKETEKIWDGEKSKALPTEIQQVARRKLRMINNADNINDLRIPPANRLKKLKGELSDFYSIRINDQWRIIFNWKNNNAENVQITDYHE
ncbi:MAG: type II toxin-antitoxin system RelE/ParE family toxin [Saprospiraceae bacterium]|nr:type II toxin-antitoxin system RelE/ParE family toxin [Saprospiraceae bacterium]